MCGICGIISNQRFDAEVVPKMNSNLVHRGPDGEGYYEHDGLSMAMRRLSVIDVNSSSQPLYNEDRSLVLMLNGEIYNYIELREQLIKLGHQFSTNGDGETILHLYEEYGVKCLEHLRGMFAFALWDTKQKQLFIARDRMGEKPLYIYSDKNTFVFSSELRSLMSSKCVDLTLDPFAVDLFFHYHYIPEPYTPIKNVRKLPAAHYLLIDQKEMRIKEECYWRMEDSKAIAGDAVQIIREQLYEAGKLVIRSDVPVGVALSGGIDSGIVAALAVKNYPAQMHAISVGYEGEPDVDERVDARKVADYLGLKFHELELSTHDFAKCFPEMCANTDDPIADISAFGYYSISKEAKRLGIPVMLQGQGGDELFCGYPLIRENHAIAKLKKNLLGNNTFGFVSYYKATYTQKASAHTLKGIAKGFLSYGEARGLYHKHKNEDPNIFPFYDHLDAFNWKNEYYLAFYGEYMLEGKKNFNASVPFTVDQPWADESVLLTKLISSTYLMENGIAQGDRLSMANSIELRLPLIDYKFVETVVGLRKSYNDIKMPPKFWLKEAGKDLLPDWLFERKKRGFEPPVAKWFSAILKSYGHLLPEGELVKAGILNKEMAGKMSGGFGVPNPVFPSYFNALVLELWYRNMKEIVQAA